MPGAHRQDDTRKCGAKTNVEGQSSVKVNGKLWAVEGDPNSHIEGKLKATVGALNVKIEGKLVIVSPGDTAGSDKKGHPGPPTDPDSSSSDVFAYGH